MKKISEQVEELEQEIERLNRSRDVMIDKVSLFVTNYVKGVDYVPENRKWAMVELLRLLKFSCVQPEEIPEDRKEIIKLMELVK